MTTTDGEQPDDSFDLIDVPAEMSPSPTTSSSQPPSSGHLGHTDDAVVNSRTSSPSASPTSPISVAANQTTPPLPAASSPTSPLCGFDGTDTAAGPSSSRRSRLESGQPDGNHKATTSSNQGHNASTSSNATEAATALPPPTPMVGTHQESRFTFGGSGRTPPLPDLRAADFFR